jgi:hypothetical protein
VFAYWILNHIEDDKLFSKEEILGIMLGCLGHDLNHPGMNNGYFIKTKDDLSKIVTKYIVDDESAENRDLPHEIENSGILHFVASYKKRGTITKTFLDHKHRSNVLNGLGLDNQNSVLENMHLRIAFHLIDNDGDSLLDGVPADKLEYVKQIIADGVL